MTRIDISEQIRLDVLCESDDSDEISSLIWFHKAGMSSAENFGGLTHCILLDFSLWFDTIYLG